MAKPHSVLGVIWIDAHADLHSPYTTPSGNMHGMSLAASIGADNQRKTIRDIESSTISFWEEFKNLGKISPKISPEHIAYVSLRDYEAEELHLIKKMGIANYKTGSIFKYGVDHIVTSIFNQLKDCTDIYVSFDVDCLDPAFSIGTGLPVEGGILPEDAIILTSLLLENPKVKCFEVTEYNPFLDYRNETGKIVYNILENVIAVIEGHEILRKIMSD
jgi:arginase